MLNLELDHLGIIVKSIENEVGLYKKLGYTEISDIFTDENQNMRGKFLKSNGGGEEHRECCLY